MLHYSFQLFIQHLVTLWKINICINVHTIMYIHGIVVSMRKYVYIIECATKLILISLPILIALNSFCVSIVDVYVVIWINFMVLFFVTTVAVNVGIFSVCLLMYVYSSILYLHEQVDILISKNQVLQILYLKHCVYKTT